jgi:hypothetical protein
MLQRTYFVIQLERTVCRKYGFQLEVNYLFQAILNVSDSESFIELNTVHFWVGLYLGLCRSAQRVTWRLGLFLFAAYRMEIAADVFALIFIWRVYQHGLALDPIYSTMPLFSTRNVEPA